MFLYLVFKRIPAIWMAIRRPYKHSNTIICRTRRDEEQKFLIGKRDSKIISRTGTRVRQFNAFLRILLLFFFRWQKKELYIYIYYNVGPSQ